MAEMDVLEEREARPTRWRRLAAFAALAAVVGVAATGCGSDSGGGGSTTGGTDSAAYLANVKQQVQKYLKGTYESPPTTAPKPQPGKNIWLISTGQALTLSANAVLGGAEAAKKMGWKATVFDGKFDPTVWAQGIRQAIADKADGIMLYIIDCNLVKGPLQQAKAAGIPVVGMESLDCDFTNPGDKPLLADTPPYVEGKFSKWIRDYGTVQALWTINKEDGKPDTLLARTDEAQAFTQIRLGVEREYKKCPECKLTDYAFKNADLGPTLRSKTEQALLRNPNADSINLSYDGLAPGGVAAAVQSSGRDIQVVGSEGDRAVMEILRSGKPGYDAGVGIPSQWEGYAAMDALNRVFHQQKVVGSGIGLQLFDKDHNVPPSGPYKAPFDFKAIYAKAWGVG